MQIRLPGHLASGYKSPTQQARVVTEAWGEENLYCLSCPSPWLQRTPHGTKVIDYICPRCDAPYQLKGRSSPLGGRILDAAYDKMRQAVLEGNAPNLLALHYERANWTVRNLILVPFFVFTESAIEKRNPLSATARRHGWVGCNIVLANLPEDARIPLLIEGKAQEPTKARKQYERLRPLQEIRLETRGWTLDVLKCVRKLNKQEFTLAEVYEFSNELARLHPRNRHIEEKIRQQLQRLRDLGILEFVGPGRYWVKR